MRILFLDTYYPRFLEHALADRGAANDSYVRLRDYLLRLRFGTSDFYTRHLRALGHEAEDIITNCATLQHLWATEAGYAPPTMLRIPRRIARLPLVRDWSAVRDPLTAIIAEQVRRFRPDALYLQDLNICPPSLLRALKTHTRLLVGQIACPLPSREYLKPFDLILTSFPHYVDRFRAMGVASEYFRIAFEPSVLDELGQVKRDLACTFVGGISAAHGQRTKFLEHLARHVDIQFFGYGNETLSTDSPVVARHQGEAWAMDMYRVLARSRITVNIHIDVAENFANNMRLYEATGCGALLITDRKDNLSKLFEIGTELLAYANPDEAVELIQYYSSRPEIAGGIAEAGKRRTLREHTYRQRMEELVSILSHYLA